MQKIKIGKYEENTKPDSKLKGKLTGVVGGELEEYLVYSETFSEWLREQPKNTEIEVEIYFGKDKVTGETTYQSISKIKGVEGESKKKAQSTQPIQEKKTGGGEVKSTKPEVSQEVWDAKEKRDFRGRCLAYSTSLAAAKLIRREAILPQALEFLSFIYETEEAYTPTDEELNETFNKEEDKVDLFK